MSLFLPGKKVRHRRFSYDPRFYNPERDNRIKRRLHVKRRTKRRSPAGLIFFALLLAMVLFMYMKLG